MPAEQTVAIVLRAVEFSETSLIVTLFTQDFGRLSAIAKGARRPKGPFEGSLDLLSVCRVVVHRKSSDVLDLLTEAKLHRRFRGGERSLPRVYGGFYVAEILRALTDDHDPHRDAYDLTINVLNQIDGSGDVASAILHYEAQLLRVLGHAPGLDRCTDCGNTVNQTKHRMAFSLSAGGIVCDACGPKQHGILSIRHTVIEQMRKLITTDSQLQISVTPSVYGELRAVMNRYIESIIGTVPRTQSSLPKTIESN